MKNPVLKFAALLFSLTAVTLLFCYQMGYFTGLHARPQTREAKTNRDSVATEGLPAHDLTTTSDEQAKPKKLNSGGSINADESKPSRENAENRVKWHMFSSKSAILPPPISPVVLHPEIIIAPVDSTQENPATEQYLQPSREQPTRMPSSKVLIMPPVKPVVEDQKSEATNEQPSVKSKPRKATGQTSSPSDKSPE